MSDFAQLLLKEQENPNVAIIEFFASSIDPKDVSVFVEGDDDPKFYYDFVKERFPGREIRFFNCKNKLGVLSASDYFSDYKYRDFSHRMLFFCDSDFDLINETSRRNVISTEFYSIESYFADVNFLEYAIKKFGGMSVSSAQRSKWLRETESVIDWMSKKLVVPMAAVCYIRRRNYDFDFDRLSIEKLFSRDAKTGVLKALGRRLSVMSGIVVDRNASYECSEIRQIAKKMKNINYKCWVRGKLALQMVRMAARIANDNANFVPKLVANRICSLFGGEVLAHGYSYLRRIEGI